MYYGKKIFRVVIITTLVPILSFFSTSYGENPKPVVPFKLPGYYQPLFEKGRTWTYNATCKMQLSIPVDQNEEDFKHEETEKSFTLTCRIEDVKIQKESVASSMKCVKEPEDVKLELGPLHDDCDSFETGIYLATAKGLYFLKTAELPRDESLLESPEPDSVLMPVDPKENSWTKADGPYEDAVRYNITLRSIVLPDNKNIKAWCYRVRSEVGDPSGSELCLGMDLGIVSYDSDGSWATGGRSIKLLLVKTSYSNLR